MLVLFIYLITFGEMLVNVHVAAECLAREHLSATCLRERKLISKKPKKTVEKFVFPLWISCLSRNVIKPHCGTFQSTDNNDHNNYSPGADNIVVLKVFTYPNPNMKLHSPSKDAILIKLTVF